jgi:hypothetical protein
MCLSSCHLLSNKSFSLYYFIIDYFYLSASSGNLARNINKRMRMSKPTPEEIGSHRQDKEGEGEVDGDGDSPIMDSSSLPQATTKEGTAPTATLKAARVPPPQPYVLVCSL